MDIKIRNLSKCYENNIIFKDLNIDINQGDFIVIKGASGSGKTTLGSIIGNVEKPSKGTVNYSESKKELFRKHIGFVFQNYGLIENETIYKNLEFGFIGKGDVTNEVQLCNEALAAVGLKCDLNKKVKILSGGEKQRLAIARILLKDPDVIIADEPTGNLDVDNTKKIYKLLINFHKMGKTIILITHKDMEYEQVKYVNLK